MTKEELHQLRIDLTKGIIEQWVKDGMTLEEAKTLWREIENSK